MILSKQTIDMKNGSQHGPQGNIRCLSNPKKESGLMKLKVISDTGQSTLADLLACGCVLDDALHFEQAFIPK